MKKTVAVFFLFIVTQSFGQKNVFKKGLIIEKNYYTEINFEFISEKIIIPIEIENKVYRFMLDTGAPNLISANLKSIIKTVSIKNINVRDATNRQNSLEIVSIPEINFGGVIFKNCPTLVDKNKDNLIFDCFEIDGIIGSNMLQKSIVQIDLKEKVIRLTDTKKKLNLNKENAAKLYLIGGQKSPYIWINLKGKTNAREQLLIDTGMKGFYDLSLKNFGILQKNDIYKVHNEGIGSKSIGLFGVAKKSKHYRVSVEDLKINNTTFINVTTETTNDSNSRIGSEILKYGIMTIDFLNKKFYFNSFENTINLQEKILGFSPTIINNKLAVGIVWDGDLKKEISFGDEIIKLNTLDVTKIDICDFITSKTIYNKKDTIELTVKTSKGLLKTLLVEKTLPK
ncbi:aspartyl protease family protein [Wocania ichthyoenteri]|uniref:aspartyl protease family protein n=1 Tax=Wocania ichthyoenteri TaxID=1230531 RepID=UPI00053EAE92|nr:aspartyl protease family protein [Wocania ichthyoenteri]